LKNILVVFICVLIYTDIFGQGADYIVVHKPGKKKRYYYHTGSFIIVKPQQDFPVRKGVISAISANAIYFSTADSILFSDIHQIILKEDTRPLSSGLWLQGLIGATGSIAIWQAAWLVNGGSLSPDVKAAPGIIAFVTLLPIVVNQTGRLLITGKRKISPDNWQIAAISISGQ
jgi:hypothetical protein